MASKGLRREGSFRFNWRKDWLTSSIRGVGEVGDMKRAERWPDPRLLPEQLAARRMVADNIRADRDRHLGLNGIFYGLLVLGVGSGAIAYAMARGEDSKAPDAAIAGSGDTGPTPDLITPVPAGIVETLVATPTRVPPIITPLPPSATFVLTETAPEVPTPTRIPPTAPEEYVLDTEHGELEPLDCRDIDVEKHWQECYRRFVQKVTPLLQEDWGQFTTDSSSYIGYWKDYPNIGVTAYQDLAYLRAIPFYWNRPDGWIADEKRPDYIFAFGLQEPGRGKVILPAMPFDAYGAGRNAVGVKVFYYLPAKDLIRELQPGEVLHEVYVQHSWWVKDKVAEFILSQEDIYPNDHILPLHLFNDITKN